MRVKIEGLEHELVVKFNHIDTFKPRKIRTGRHTTVDVDEYVGTVTTCYGKVNDVRVFEVDMKCNLEDQFDKSIGRRKSLALALNVSCADFLTEKARVAIWDQYFKEHSDLRNKR